MSSLRESLTVRAYASYKHLTMQTPLKLARERRKMIQRDVALAVGIVRSHYGRVEAGLVGASPELAKRLCDFFGAPLTRDQILYPEEYIPADGRRPVQSECMQEA